MRNREATRYKNQLDDLFVKVTSLSGDVELQSHWARYLCIRTSGFIETSVRAIYGEYAKNKSHPHIANFVQSKLGSFQNPTMKKILELTHSFDPVWAENLKNDTQGELKDAIDSIVNNRNSIAHGQDVTITLASIKEYYKSVIKVIELLEKQCE